MDQLRSTVLAGEVLTELDASGGMYRTFIRANGTVIATQNSIGTTAWMHKDLAMTSMRATDSNGDVINTGGGDDLDRNELGPNGKTLGFYDPYTGGVPDPTNNIFIPGQNFSSMVNGQMTSFTVNGIPVTQGHFSQMTDTAFGGLFGIMEAQLRSFRIRDYTVRSIGEDGQPQYQTFATETEARNAGQHYSVTNVYRNIVYNDSWAVSLMSVTFPSQSENEPPTPPPPPKSKVLQRAIDLARLMLKDKECNDAVSGFANGARSAAATLDLNDGTVDERPDDEGKDWFGEGSSLAYTWPPPSLTISFYKGFYGDANANVDDDMGKATLTSMDLIPGEEDADLRRAWVVLHELSHATGRYVGHRGPTASSSATVNRRIYDACLKKMMESRHGSKK